jgi:hypothetical protein
MKWIVPKRSGRVQRGYSARLPLVLSFGGCQGRAGAIAVLVVGEQLGDALEVAPRMAWSSASALAMMI